MKSYDSQGEANSIVKQELHFCMQTDNDISLYLGLQAGAPEIAQLPQWH